MGLLEFPCFKQSFPYSLLPSLQCDMLISKYIWGSCQSGCSKRLDRIVQFLPKAKSIKIHTRSITKAHCLDPSIMPHPAKWSFLRVDECKVQHLGRQKLQTQRHLHMWERFGFFNRPQPKHDPIVWFYFYFSLTKFIHHLILNRTCKCLTKY